MNTIGLKLISSLISAEDKESYLKLHLVDDYFTKTEMEAYDFIKGHIETYGSLPAKETLQEHLDPFGLKIPVANDSIDYYYDEVVNRYITTSMKRNITEAKASMLTNNPRDVLDELISNFISLSMEHSDLDIINFKESGTILHEDYKDKIYNDDNGSVAMGWPYIDTISGGFSGGDVISLIGRPGKGKTYQLLYAAHNAWYMQKKNVLFISMEMLPLPIIQRLAAIHTKYSITNLKSVPMPSNGYYHVFKELSEITDHESNFWVVDGNLTASVDDIWKIARQLKPDAIYVDGAYLVQTDNKRLTKWDRIGYVVEALKSRVATMLKVPVFATYQFNKGMVKKKSLDEVGLEDIYGSDVIGQVSSVVLGLFDGESIESLVRKKVSLLKGRNGEVGSFLTHWDFLTMDFSEITISEEEEKKKELQYA